MENRELTFGEKAVGLTFNPSNDPRVDKVKKLYAEVIDMLDNMRNEPIPEGMANSTERNRLLSIAITEAQGAQMWAVKGFTWR